MVSFKGAQYPKDITLFAVFFYVRYGVSYRDLEEIMGERGVQVDHTTLNRWVIYGIQVRWLKQLVTEKGDMTFPGAWTKLT